MAKAGIILRREELYGLVWSVPLLQLAKRYDLSDQGLAKICKRMEIPLPGLGFWAKRAAGQQTIQKPLQPLTTGVAEYELRPPNPVQGPKIPNLCEDPSHFHPLVQKTLEALGGASLTPGQKYLSGAATPHLHLDVRPETLNRALQLMDYLIKELETRGFTVAIKGGKGNFETWIKSKYDECSIYLRESLDVSYGKPYDPSTVIFASSGYLAIEVNNCARTYLRQTRWKDFKKKKLEHYLDEILSDFACSAAEHEKVRKQREEEYRIEKILREKQGFLERIERQIHCHQRATAIREFVAATRAAKGSSELTADDAALFEQWARTAEELADKMDPFTGQWAEEPPDFVMKNADTYDEYPSPSYAPWWFVKGSKGWK